MSCLPPVIVSRARVSGTWQLQCYNRILRFFDQRSTCYIVGTNVLRSSQNDGIKGRPYCSVGVSSKNSTFHNYHYFVPNTNPRWCNALPFSSSTSGRPPYEERVELFDIDSKEELLELSKEETCIFLDVRSSEEQLEHGTLCPTTYKNRIVHAPVTMKDFQSIKRVVTDPSSLLKQDVPIIVFCAMGRRANGVQKILEDHGYRHVYNAGGFCDLDFLQRTIPTK